MMNSARRVRRPLGAALGLSLAVGTGLASCANGEETGLGGGEAASASAGASRGGMSGMSGMKSGGIGGMSFGGSTANGGTLPMSGSGGAQAGTGTGGTPSSGGNGLGGSTLGAGNGGTTAAGGAGGNAAASGTAGTFPGGGRGGNMGGAGKAGAGGVAGGAGTSSSGGSGNTGNVAPPPDIQGGMQAWASRYWDCCKPACGWSGNVGGRTPAKSCDKSGNPLGDNDAKNACESGGSAYACFSDRPWQVGDKLSYGFVAKNDTCGRCFHVQFTGTSHNGGQDMSTQALSGKHMIVQVINNGAIASDQFDFLIPGGGVGALDACTNNQFSTSDLGAQYGGFLAGCNGDHTCVKNKCQTVFAGKQDLLDGCDWFLGWFNGADNPNFTYQKIACPAEITQRSGLGDPG